MLCNTITFSPGNATCSPEVVSTPVYPCYGLQQFCHNQELLSGNGSVKLLFMSGVHQINNCTISASNLELLPLSFEEKVTIKCHRKAKFKLTIKDLKYHLLKVCCL